MRNRRISSGYGQVGQAIESQVSEKAKNLRELDEKARKKLGGSNIPVRQKRPAPTILRAIHAIGKGEAPVGVWGTSQPTNTFL
jgi:hypothetical protein